MTMDQNCESDDDAERASSFPEDINEISNAGRSLYISHFLSTWNSRGFEFGAVLFLASIYPNTLLPMSVYALIRAAAGIIVSPLIGQYVDTNQRLKVARHSIVGQRLPVSLSCVALMALLKWHTRMMTWMNTLLFAILTILACVEKLSATMNTVAIERDWVVVIAGEDENLLQNMNSQMRRIDLICKLISPFAIGLLHSWSPEIAVLTTLIINLVSAGVEYALIAKIFNMNPALANRSYPDLGTASSSDQDDDPQRTGKLGWSICSCCPDALQQYLHPLQRSVKQYIQSPAFLPSFALSCLYLTVLSFSGQMTTFLLALSTPHFNSASIALLRTASVSLEISATFVAPYVMSSIGPTRAGIWFLSWQAVSLSCGVGMLWTLSSAETANTAIASFIVGIILSRVGLWSFDLSAQLIIQEAVDSDYRGSFSATEASLQNVFELCAYASTIAFSRTDQFKYPAAISLVAVYVAAAVYAKFVRDRRGHLFHMPPCVEIKVSQQRHSHHDEQYRRLNSSTELDGL